MVFWVLYEPKWLLLPTRSFFHLHTVTLFDWSNLSKQAYSDLQDSHWSSKFILSWIEFLTSPSCSYFHEKNLIKHFFTLSVSVTLTWVQLEVVFFFVWSWDPQNSGKNILEVLLVLRGKQIHNTYNINVSY